MGHRHTQLEVLQAGKGKEAIESWSKAGPGTGCRRAESRGALRGEEDGKVSVCGEESGQEGSAPAASGSSAGSDVRDASHLPGGAIPQTKNGLSAAAAAFHGGQAKTEAAAAGVA